MRHSKHSFAVISLVTAFLSIAGCLSEDKKSTSKPAAGKPIKFENDSFQVRPLTDIRYEATPERLRRGGYLANSILMCFTCHSPRDWKSTGAPLIDSMKGAGGTIVSRDSVTTVIAPNITSDKETGAGSWTDDMIGRAIREGVGHDGRALNWQMPYMIFRNLADEDLASVVVYLRTLPAVHNVVEPTKMSKEERSGTQKVLRPIVDPVPTPDTSDAVKRGRYLVRIGECVGCHTVGTEYNPGIFGGGNFAHRYNTVAFSANLTPDSSGIAYNENGFIFTMRTGKGGILSPVMPWMSFKNLTDDDLKAIYAYLRTLPPARHYVSNQKPFSKCAVCGQVHGLGSLNKRMRPSGIKLDPRLYDQFNGTYREDKWNETYIIKRKGDKLIAKGWENGPELELVPQSELRYLGGGIVLPINFVKDEKGKVIKIVEDTDYGREFKKVSD